MKLRNLLLTVAFALLAGCAVIPKESAPEQLIVPPAGPTVFIVPKVPKSLWKEQVWVNVSVAFEERGRRGKKVYLRPVDIKLVDASHPGSSALIKSVEKSIGLSVFPKNRMKKPFGWNPGVGEFKGKRYLIRLAQSANNPAVMEYVRN